MVVTQTQASVMRVTLNVPGSKTTLLLRTNSVPIASPDTSPCDKKRQSYRDYHGSTARAVNGCWVLVDNTMAYERSRPCSGT